MSSKRRLLLLLGAWDLVWKVIAVRRAVKNRQYKWIPPLAVVNSVGILPIVYLLHWAKRPDPVS